MQWLKLNGKRYMSLCACDEPFCGPPFNKKHCYGDNKCPLCGYYPWVRSKKVADELMAAGVKRKEA